MTRILTQLVTASIDNERYVQLISPFIFESDVLLKAGLKHRCEVPAGFVYDFESVPLARGTNKRGGTAHDYLSRIDSDPIVTKAIAAEVYREIMEYCYARDCKGLIDRFNDWTRRWFKWGVVRLAPGYFHKWKVLSTSREIAGYDGDPYVTVEELQADIRGLEKEIQTTKDDAAESIDKAEVKIENKEAQIEKIESNEVH